ncbi:unnamed protein product [Durusdinium trenchii]|uniref:Uncharacterized protein n=2 Tax=Durusdinium trenchii TaxID=1381693 RepID=A0ABP0MH23_9DINO
MLFAGEPAGLDEALPDPVEDVCVLAKAAEQGDIKRFTELLETAAVKDLNAPQAQDRRGETETPFSLLLQSLRNNGVLGQDEKHAIYKAAEAGADWSSCSRTTGINGSMDPFRLLLQLLIELKILGTNSADELIDLAISTGARWRRCPHGSQISFSDEWVSLNNWGIHQPVMTLLFEGGGTMFSNVVQIAMRHDLLGTPDGQALLEFCYARGARWDIRDGWNQTSFLELLECALQHRRRELCGKRSIEDNLKVVRGILECQQDSHNLWNGSEVREKGDACETTFYYMLRALAEAGLVGLSIARQYISTAEEFGAKWDAIAWNYSPPWGIYEKGKLTNFHSLVDLLGHAGCLEHPDTVTILSRALEFGADFAVDDHRPPGRRRIVAHIPNLLWTCRRQMLVLIALLSHDRAITGPDDVGAALNWLALLVKRQHGPAISLKVGHPVVRLVFSFLPRVPPVLGYDFKTEGRGGRSFQRRHRSAEEGL